MKNISDTSCAENQETHFIFSNFFPPKIAPFGRKCGKIWYSQTDHRWQHSTAHVHCTLDNQGYRHTLRICNIYCFSV